MGVRLSGDARVVVAVGETSRREAVRRPAGALGTTPVRFPGDHGGFTPQPAGSAATVRQVPAGAR